MSDHESGDDKFMAAQRRTRGADKAGKERERNENGKGHGEGRKRKEERDEEV
jgi:hypothetical protein